MLTTLNEQRSKELEEMKQLLQMPVVERYNVLLLVQGVKVKHRPEGDTSKTTVFWDDGSTCSLVKNETAEILGCPNEPITVSN